MSSPLTPAERMAHARAAMRDKYLAEARDQFARLGVTPTEEQVEQAGERLLKDAQRDRMAVARASRHPEHEKRTRNVEWGLRQVMRTADLLQFGEAVWRVLRPRALRLPRAAQRWFRAGFRSLLTPEFTPRFA